MTVEVTEELFQLYVRMANREGLSLQEWARKALNTAVPSIEIRRFEHSALRAAGIEAAYEHLDRDESLLLLSAPAAPQPKALPMVPGHPCAHLRATYPQGFTARDCQGSCASPRQEGRICHWASAVANQCPVFDPKLRLAAR